MKNDLLRLAGLVGLVVTAPGCKDEPPPAPVVVVEPPKPAAPSPEELKKAEAQKKLVADRAKADADNKKEVERWTPELHAAAKALADKAYPNAKAALTAVVASKARVPGHADRDSQRHPVETLTFFGFTPTQTVLEFGPGEGWYTELLAPALAAKGKLLATSSDPNGPADSRATMSGQVWSAHLATSPELYGKVETVITNNKEPKLPQEGTVDLVLLARELHGMVNGGTLDEWLAQIHKALKPGGIVGVEQHRAKPGVDPIASAKNGYLPEAWVIEKFAQAGFKLAGKSEINANSKDTKDYAEGVWTLPPSFTLGDKDHDKYAAIGESDRMTLKFVSVAVPPRPDADAGTK